VSQQPIEVILAKQLASHLACPVFLVDTEGTLLYYNEPAEGLLGLRFEETGAMPVDAWGTAFNPTDENGQPLDPEHLPLVRALRERRTASGRIRIRGLDGIDRGLDIVALPLEGHGGRRLGALAVFTELTT
jgi:PAS domain-containing protein